MWEKKKWGEERMQMLVIENTQNQKHFFPHAWGQEHQGTFASCFAYVLMGQERRCRKGPWRECRETPKNRHFIQRRVICQTYIILGVAEQHRLWHQSMKNIVGCTITNPLSLQQEAVESAVTKPHPGPCTSDPLGSSCPLTQRLIQRGEDRRCRVSDISLALPGSRGAEQKVLWGPPQLGSKPHFCMIRCGTWTTLLTFSWALSFFFRTQRWLWKLKLRIYRSRAQHRRGRQWTRGEGCCLEETFQGEGQLSCWWAYVEPIGTQLFSDLVLVWTPRSQHRHECGKAETALGQQTSVKPEALWECLSTTPHHRGHSWVCLWQPGTCAQSHDNSNLDAMRVAKIHWALYKF